jgi:hypothetical protein
MKEQIAQRLAQLKSEFESGQKMLADLDTQRANLQQTLLRISGAIQVLEELSAQSAPSRDGAGDLADVPYGSIDAAA